MSFIKVRGARENNLKNVNIDIPRDKITVFTGLSGSGKSSLAFDTIYAEGRRRYIESLSSYARQFLEMHAKPDVDTITGLSPAIAIDQKSTSKNPRSTVATVTEIYDYMRVLFARIGKPHSPITGLQIEKQTSGQIAEKLICLGDKVLIHILSSIAQHQKGEYRKELVYLRKQGISNVIIDGINYTFSELPLLDKNIKHTIEAFISSVRIGDISQQNLENIVSRGLNIGNGSIVVRIVEIPENYCGNHKVQDELTFCEKFACPISGLSIQDIEPRLFSFNSPYGACQACDGLGKEMFFDPRLIVPNTNLSLVEGAISPWMESTGIASKQSKIYAQTLLALAKHYNFSLDTKFCDLTQSVHDILMHGSNSEIIEFHFDNAFKKTTVKEPFIGVVQYLENLSQQASNGNIIDSLSVYQAQRDCSSCQGHRLKLEALCIKIDGKHVGDVCSMSITDSIKWFKNLSSKLNNVDLQISERIIKELESRLGFLENVGLEYLTLNRRSSALSGGESQRIRLASQIGSGLSGVLYVLDEPSIGLHQCDNDKLLDTLKHLRDLNNTVIVVEHDHDTMLSADYLVDVGIGAGSKGGNIVAQGTPLEVAANDDSITGQYLSGKLMIPLPQTRRDFKNAKYIKVFGATSHNLKNIDAEIPLGNFVAITGVSGSGKSTFTILTLYRLAVRKLHSAKVIPGKYSAITGLEYIDKVVEVDQSPIGRTPRSNPATYTGAFNLIRDWFAELNESKSKGYNSGRFSFNVKGGRCETCEGDGVIKIEMHFLPDVYVQCEECYGKRYNKETLQICYKGNSISNVLDMTVDDAVNFFCDVPLIYEKLFSLQEVGLGYIKIGQSATTLSGGEAQRIKLAKELARKSTGRTLYILDEPTTGLHTHDIKQLLSVLHKLVDKGNSVVVIEHNLDVIKTADYIIDFGPKGGNNGGNIVVSGSPEDVALCADSITGQYLKKYLSS